MISLDEVSFRPEVGLNGFRVVGFFDINTITCEDLSEDITQLAVILYPPELFNEKFLIRMRDCVLKMSDSHPVKVWLKDVADVAPLEENEQKIRAFLVEVLNSQFNLITDLKMKARIVGILTELPEKTLAEKLLKSYLYLIIGNITRSDNILRGVIQRRPFENWQSFEMSRSFYHQLANENIGQLLMKLSGHPSDRMIYQLFNLYIQNFYQDQVLLEYISDFPGKDVSEKLGLKYIEKIAPAFIDHLRLDATSEVKRVQKIKNTTEYPLIEQAYWHWPFLDIDPLITDDLYSVLQKIEKQDPLWFIYLMDNERLSDMYYKKTKKSPLSGRRNFLRSNLDSRELFMLSLFKLIELGDINQSLVSKTLEFMTHE